MTSTVDDRDVRRRVRIPHPVVLFGLLLALLAVVASTLAWCGVVVARPGAPAEPIRAPLSAAGVRWLVEHVVDNFVGFPPLGITLITLMAVGVAERTGFLSTAVLVGLHRVPRRLMPLAVTAVAAQGHVMGDASMVVLPPLAALAFGAVGRHPLAGALGAFAAAAGGYGGGVLLGAFDATIGALTRTAAPAGALGPGSDATLNYWFQACSGVLLPLVTAVVLVRLVEPTLPPAPPRPPDRPALSAPERRGLRRSVLALACYAAVVLAAWLPPGAPLRGPDGGLVTSPVLTSVVTFVAVGFLLAGIVHGRATGTVRRAADVPELMADALRSTAGYVVLAVAAGQFVGLFGWTHLGDLLATSGAGALSGAGGGLALAGLVLLSFALSLVISSGAGAWSVLAPVAVPLLTALGVPPAAAQAAFRVGDSVAHPVSPMNPYLYALHASVGSHLPGLTVAGTIRRLALFVVPMLVAWSALLALFLVLGLPLGFR